MVHQRASKAQTAIELPSGATAGRLKAQAAMEYLVTYGWALLILFVVVAYLLTSGAFSANSFASCSEPTIAAKCMGIATVGLMARAALTASSAVMT